MRSVRLRRSSGVTLIELLMTVAVSSFVIAGMASAFISQAKQYQVHTHRRALQSNGRQGLSFVESALRRAGYGVDPWLAITPFDGFDAATNSQVDNYPDAVTLLSRDAKWRRQVNAAGTTAAELHFTPPLVEPLRRGQILLLLGCNASQAAYVTVGQTSAPTASSVTLEAAGPATETPLTGPGSRFHQQNALTAGTESANCLVNNNAVVVKIDRLSFFVAAFPERAETPVATWTPYLMLHRGLDMNEPADGVIDIEDATPVAADVEQLQLSYVLNTTSTANPIIRGTDPASAWVGGTAWDVVASRPPASAPYTDPRRLTDHPANIRQVRLTLVSRSSVPDPDRTGGSAFTPAETYASGELSPGTLGWRQLENLDGVLPPPFDPTVEGYLRNTLRVTVSTKNLLMRSQFKPITLGGG